MEQENKKPKFRFKIIGLVLLAIAIAFAAGIGGELFTRLYLSNFSYFRDFYFTDTSNLGQGEIIIRDPRKVVVEQDLRLSQIKNEIQPSVLSIYKRQKTGKNLLENIFITEDYLGQAIVLTSDGWLIGVQNIALKPKESVVIGANKKIYEIEKIVGDQASNLVFIKISAQNLSVVKLADLSNINDGQQVLAYDSFLNQLNLANIANKKYKAINNRYDLVNSTQILDKTILVNNNFTSDFNSAPVFNFQSEFLGFLHGQDLVVNKIIPINYINSIINQVLKEEAIKRPYLGLNYIDLSQVDGLDETVRQGSSFGALIWSNQKGLAIAADSPLVGKLIKGDVITSIENQTLDANNDLTNLLLEYKSGQEIRLKYLHEQKEAEISVILK